MCIVLTPFSGILISDQFISIIISVDYAHIFLGGWGGGMKKTIVTFTGLDCEMWTFNSLLAEYILT